MLLRIFEKYILLVLAVILIVQGLALISGVKWLFDCLIPFFVMIMIFSLGVCFGDKFLE